MTKHMSHSDDSRSWRVSTTDLVVELALFWCSYAPLFAILAVRFNALWLIVGCGVLAVGGLIAGALVLWRFRTVSGHAWSVRTVDDRGSDVAGYLATYLLPFVAVSEPGWRDVLAYMLFLAIIAVVYIRSSLIQINPTLYLLGWRLFAIDIGNGWSGYVLTRGPIASGRELHAVRMTERLFVSYDKRGSHDGH
jgi:hypothetical protein